MFNLLALLWLGTATLTLASHCLLALAIDGRIALGTWDKLALLLFALLGPLGLALETTLLIRTCRDIYRQPPEPAPAKALRKDLPPQARRSPVDLRQGAP